MLLYLLCILCDTMLLSKLEVLLRVVFVFLCESVAKLEKVVKDYVALCADLYMKIDVDGRWAGECLVAGSALYDAPCQ